jgi:hypothetical protein
MHIGVRAVEKQVDITELKPSEYVKMLGIELPPSVAEFWDRAGHVEGDGWIDFPDASSANIVVEGYVFASDGKPLLDREMVDAVWYYLFDRDPRYGITHTHSGAEPLEGSEYAHHLYGIVYDRKLQCNTFRVVATFTVTVLKRDPEGVPRYAQAILDYVSVKPMAQRCLSRGFTRKVLEMLKSEQMRCISEDYCSGVISAEKLVKVAELVPEDNLEDRQNESPRFRDFVEVAKAEPRAKFEVYVITEVREDERVTVEGALMPLDRADLIIQLLDKALREPDECKIIKMCTPECTYYIRMWWD